MYAEVVGESDEEHRKRNGDEIQRADRRGRERERPDQADGERDEDRHRQPQAAQTEDQDQRDRNERDQAGPGGPTRYGVELLRESASSPVTRKRTPESASRPSS